MIEYVVMFILSIISFKIALIFKNKKTLFYIFSCIGIILPCMLAGLRDTSIGTDTKHFAMYGFKYASSYESLSDFLMFFQKGEFLYWIICWISANIFHNIGVSFFIYELLVVLPIYVALIKIKKSDNTVIFGMLLFYLLCYNQSLNLVRQSIALSFSILALVFLEEKKYFKVIFFTIVAFLFHMSAIIMFIIYAIYFVLNLNLKKCKIIVELIMAIIFIFLLINYETILTYMGEMFKDGVGIYSEYLDSEFYKTNSGNFFLVEFVINCILILLMIIFKNNIKEYTKNYDFYFFILLIAFSSNYLSNIIQSSERVMYYIKYPLYFIIFSRLPFYLKNNNKIIITSSILLYSLYFFIFNIVIHNANETVPYIFR